MAIDHPVGDVRSSPIVTGSKLDYYGTNFDFLGIGGYGGVATMAELYAIPVHPQGLTKGDPWSSGRRRLLMRRHVLENNITFILYVPNYIALSDENKYAALKDNGNWINVANVDYPLTASNTQFNPSVAQLTATNVQQALEEINAKTVGGEIIEVIPINTDGQTIFQLEGSVTDFGKTKFFVNGLKQRYGADYTGSGTQLTWLSTDYPLRQGKHYLELYYS